MASTPHHCANEVQSGEVRQRVPVWSWQSCAVTDRCSLDHPDPTATLPTGEPTYDVVWPKSPAGVQPWRLAPRVTALDGKRVAFVWDYMFRGEELFPVLERELHARFTDLEVVGFDAFGNIHGPDEESVVDGLADRLTRHRIDVAVVGNGC
jgi:hypothetical protein